MVLHPLSTHKTLIESEKSRPGDILEVEVTTRCMLECPQCPRVAFADTWIERDMSWEVFERVLSFSRRYRTVKLQGWGEPMLHPRIQEMIRALRETPVRIVLSTSGALAVPPRVLESVDTLVFRLGSGKARTYEMANPEQSFNRTLFNISRAVHWIEFNCHRRPEIVISLLKNAATLRELSEYVSLAAKLAVDLVVFHEPRFYMRAVDELATLPGRVPPEIVVRKEKKLVEEARGLGVNLFMDDSPHLCPFNPGRDMFVNWKGQVSPCRFNHLPLVTGHYSFYQNGVPREVQPLYLGDLETSEELPSKWHEIIQSVRNVKYPARVNGLSSIMRKAKHLPNTFAANCPMEEIPMARFHGLCV